MQSKLLFALQDKGQPFMCRMTGKYLEIWLSLCRIIKTNFPLPLIFSASAP